MFGADGRRLEHRLHETDDWDERFDVVDRFLVHRASLGIRPHALVVAAWSRLHETAGGVRIGTLADELGFSRRHLTTVFHEQVGLAPKMVARQLRFQSVCRRLERNPARWADIAFDCGYCDQAHLNREFRDLVGITPTAFLARLIPGSRVVADEITFVQDGGAETT